MIHHAQLSQGRRLLLGFHAFGNGLDAQLLGNVDLGFDQCPINRAVGAGLNKPLVDFEQVDWELIDE